MLSACGKRVYGRATEDEYELVKELGVRVKAALGREGSRLSSAQVSVARAEGPGACEQRRAAKLAPDGGG
jgi:hypothetical protein